MPPNKPTDAVAGMQTVGWAGLRFTVPQHYRPAKTEGDHGKGLILMADEERARVLIAWATVVRTDFDPDAFCRGKLLTLAGADPDTFKITKIANSSFTTLIFGVSQAEQKVRAVGYCPATRRVIDCLYHSGTAREDLEFLEQTLGQIADQPVDSDYQWALLGSRFTVPAGFKYYDSTLNLGNQTVRFLKGKTESRGPLLAIRQLYPAKLALSRQPIQEWLDDWAAGPGASYAPATFRQGLKFPTRMDVMTVGGHDGFKVDGRLRLTLRLVYWWMPRRARFYAVHHAEMDRIVLIQCSGPESELDTWADKAVKSLQLSQQTA